MNECVSACLFASLSCCEYLCLSLRRDAFIDLCCGFVPYMYVIELWPYLL